MWTLEGRLKCQSENNGRCKRKILPWKKTLCKRDHTCFSSMISFNLSHLFLEARNLCLQNRGSNYSQPESCCLSFSKSAQKCLCAYFYGYHLLTVLQLIWLYTYRKTAMGESFWRYNEELVILRYMLTQLSLPQLAPICHPTWPLNDPMLCPGMVACRCYRGMYRCYRRTCRWS